MQMPKITLVERDKLYFGKYKYRLTFDLNGSCWTDYIRNIEQYRLHLDKRKQENTNYLGHVLRWPDLDDINVDSISKFIDYREKYHPKGQSAKIAGIYTCWNNVRIFTNDLKIIYEAFDIGGSEYLMSEVKKIDVPGGVMLFSRKPKFKYRTYFKEKRVDQKWKDELKKLFDNNPGLVPCGSLRLLLNSPSHFRGVWLNRSHFIEYDSAPLRMVLELFLDHGYLRRHYELQQKK